MSMRYVGWYRFSDVADTFLIDIKLQMNQWNDTHREEMKLSPELIEIFANHLRDNLRIFDRAYVNFDRDYYTLQETAHYVFNTFKSDVFWYVSELIMFMNYDATRIEPNDNKIFQSQQETFAPPYNDDEVDGIDKSVNNLIGVTKMRNPISAPDLKKLDFSNIRAFDAIKIKVAASLINCMKGE